MKFDLLITKTEAIMIADRVIDSHQIVRILEQFYMGGLTHEQLACELEDLGIIKWERMVETSGLRGIA